MAKDESEQHTKFEEDYSPSTTVIKFDQPIPLLRGPLPATPSDNPSEGPYVLAFSDTQAWVSSFKACERKIVKQCEEGARIGCAINASRMCKPPWWKAMSGSKVSDLKEREMCEAREMEECLNVAKVKCGGFGREKCLVPFRDARIRVRDLGLNLNSKEAANFIRWASMPEKRNMSYKCLIDCEFGVSNRRASELSDECVQHILDPSI